VYRAEAGGAWWMISDEGSMGAFLDEEDMGLMAGAVTIRRFDDSRDLDRELARFRDPGRDPDDDDDEDPVSLPTVFEVSFGGGMGETVSVRLKGDVLLYERDPGYEHILVRPGNAAWESFHRWLEVIDPWAWNGEYAQEMPPTDLPSWRLRLEWIGGSVDAWGDAYPPYGEYGGGGASPHWEVFCAAVTRLLGGLPFG
jgi:hypothetical protein